MFYPSQTSFIPVQVALARFLESHGWQAIFVNYPYWYLGTTSFRCLTGPILPSVLALLHYVLPSLNLSWLCRRCSVEPVEYKIGR